MAVEDHWIEEHQILSTVGNSDAAERFAHRNLGCLQAHLGECACEYDEEMAGLTSCSSTRVRRSGQLFICSCSILYEVIAAYETYSYSIIHLATRTFHGTGREGVTKIAKSSGGIEGPYIYRRLHVKVPRSVGSNTSYPEKQLTQIVQKYGISAEDEEKLPIITDMVFDFPMAPVDNEIFSTGLS
jgi:hypothetical protein